MSSHVLRYNEVVISDLELKTPRTIVLQNSSIHAKDNMQGHAQDFMAAMITVGLSQDVMSLKHEKEQLLDLF